MIIHPPDLSCVNTHGASKVAADLFDTNPVAHTFQLDLVFRIRSEAQARMVSEWLGRSHYLCSESAWHKLTSYIAANGDAT